MNVSHEVPDAKEYANWRLAAGLGAIEEAVAKTALSRSIVAVVARGPDSELVGMGRIVGDGACYCRIVDLAVLPARRGEGIEERLMQELLAYLEANAPDDAEVTVMSDAAAIPFYQKYGFKLVYPDLYGMVKTRTR
jgi:ribosomal protein S18 acetylase RimI-like enzyme